MSSLKPHFSRIFSSPSSWTTSTNTSTSNSSGTIIFNSGSIGSSQVRYIDDNGVLRDIPSDRATNTEVFLSDLVQRCLKLKRSEQGDNSGTIILPDGSMLVFDNNGNYEIIAKDAKVIYKANFVREFNKFINASDLIESFIKDLGAVGCTQDKVLQVPLELFVNWLIVKAAEQDEDDYAMQGIPRLEDRKDEIIRSHCRCCGRYLSRDFQRAEVNFCNDSCLNRYLNKKQLT